MKPSRPLTVAIVVTSFFLVAPEFAWARAGGGGGSNGKGSWLNIILLPILLIYSAVLTHRVRQKSRACKELLAKLEKQDAAWDLAAIRHRIMEVFLKVQHAWMERDQTLARDCMTDAIFTKHKMQTDQLLAQHRKNVLEEINLNEVNIVDVEDFADNKKDMFWVHLKGSMMDFTIDDRTQDVVAGEQKPEDFAELWKFVRAGNSWVLDEIDQKVTLSDLREFKAASETSNSSPQG